MEYTAHQSALVPTLLERAKTYHAVRSGYDCRTDEYIYWSAFCPKEQIPVGARLEPVVPAPEWLLDDNATLTINHYNALVLNTKNLLIIDVDFGDRRYDKWGVANIQQLIGYLHDLAALDASRYPHLPNPEDQAMFFPDGRPFQWSEQTWKVYTTKNGARIICTSMPLRLDSHGNRYALKTLCRFLGADPLYTQKCIEQHCYRARLTAKDQLDAGPVCERVGTLWHHREPHPDLKAQIDLHDAVCSFIECEPLPQEVAGE